MANFCWSWEFRNCSINSGRQRSDLIHPCLHWIVFPLNVWCLGSELEDPNVVCLHLYSMVELQVKRQVKLTLLVLSLLSFVIFASHFFLCIHHVSFAQERGPGPPPLLRSHSVWLLMRFYSWGGCWKWISKTANNQTQIAYPPFFAFLVEPSGSWWTKQEQGFHWMGTVCLVITAKPF